MGSEKSKTSNVSNAVYGLGFIGAAVYYIQMATTFWTGSDRLNKGRILACIYCL